MGGSTRKRKRVRRLGIWCAILAAAVVGYAFLWAQGPAVLLVWTLAVAAALVYWHRYMNDPGAVPVLVYHSVTADGSWLPWSDAISVSPETFDRHLDVLRAMGCSVLSTRDLVAARTSGAALPERPVVLHLDDGYLDNWVASYPILKRHETPATIFVSSDFIDPGETPRPTLDDVAAGRCRPEDLQWAGYLNVAEIRAMEASGLVSIESHGVTHSRVFAGPRVVDRLSPDNWRALAWFDWRKSKGSKHDWHRRPAPLAVPYGSAVNESVSALAAREWNGEGLEPEASFVARVQGELRESREVLGGVLGRCVEVFCWPFDERAASGHELALESGYLAATAGRGENRPDEDPREISRIPVGDRTLGWRCLAMEALVLRATVRLGQGNYYWYLLLLPLNQWTKLVRRLRGRASGRPA